MLAHLGITEETVGAEIRATMETEVVAAPPTACRCTSTATPPAPTASCRSTGSSRTRASRVRSRAAARRWPSSASASSPGAAQIHSCGPVRDARSAAAGIDALRETGRLLGGVASVESADGRRRRVEALGADDVGGAGELELTEHARVVRAGAAVRRHRRAHRRAGRQGHLRHDDGPERHRAVLGARPRRLRRAAVSTIVLLALTESSRRQRARHRLRRLHPGRRSPSRSTGRRRTSTASPPGRPGCADRGCRWCCPTRTPASRPRCRCAARGFDEPKRVVRIRSTLHLTRCWVSDAVLADLPPTARRVGP